MEPRKNSISIISLITSALGLFLMMSASSFNTSLVNLATLLTFVGLACALVSIFHPDYKKLCGVIGIMLCLISFIVKADLDNTRNSFPTYSKPKKTITNSTYTPSSSTNTNKYPTTTTTKPTLRNYEQIYNEYSQKLIQAGPTSSISEMAEIANEGVLKMAEYMYSAKGTDGQYSTYESWAGKLYDVYMNNCR